MRPAVPVERASVRIIAIRADIDIRYTVLQHRSHCRQLLCDIGLHFPDFVRQIDNREKLLHIDRALPDILLVYVDQGGFCQMESSSENDIVLNGDIVRVMFLVACGTLDFVEFPAVRAPSAECRPLRKPRCS